MVCRNYVDGWGWLVGSLVMLSIDDPANVPGIEYTDTQIVKIAEWDPEESFVQFNFQGIFDLQPNFVVLFTDTNHLKQHTVTDLAITDVNPDTDLVTGVATPGSHVYVWVYGEMGRIDRHEIADSPDNWTADFSVPGNEPGEGYAYDIILETGGEANQVDVDKDTTQVNWWGAD